MKLTTHNFETVDEFLKSSMPLDRERLRASLASARKQVEQVLGASKEPLSSEVINWQTRVRSLRMGVRMHARRTTNVALGALIEEGKVRAGSGNLYSINRGKKL